MTVEQLESKLRRQRWHIGLSWTVSVILAIMILVQDHYRFRVARATNDRVDQLAQRADELEAKMHHVVETCNQLTNGQ